SGPGSAPSSTSIRPRPARRRRPERGAGAARTRGCPPTARRRPQRTIGPARTGPSGRRGDAQRPWAPVPVEAHHQPMAALMTNTTAIDATAATGSPADEERPTTAPAPTGAVAVAVAPHASGSGPAEIEATDGQYGR